MPDDSSPRANLEAADDGNRTRQPPLRSQNRPGGPARNHSHNPFQHAQQYNGETLARMISAARMESSKYGKIGSAAINGPGSRWYGYTHDEVIVFGQVVLTTRLDLDHGKRILDRDRKALRGATGGVANVLYSGKPARGCHSCRHRTATLTEPMVVSHTYELRWLEGIGITFFLLNLVLFILNCILITMRFIMVPGSLMHSFLDDVESLIAIIMTNITQYGCPHTGPWLQQVMEVLFWVYLAISVVASTGMYLVLWSTQPYPNRRIHLYRTFPIQTMTPSWVFPAYPLLLNATFRHQPDLHGSSRPGRPQEQQTGNSHRGPHDPRHRFSHQLHDMRCLHLSADDSEIASGYATPWCDSNITDEDSSFLSVRRQFTVAGLVLLGQQAKDILPSDYPDKSQAVFVLELLSTLIGLWLWGLSVWFFIVSVGSLWKYTRNGHSMPFQMTWWSFVFPNTALANATLALAKALGSNGLQIYGCVLAAALVLAWIIVFIKMVWSLCNKQLLWPKELDKEG
ncbi:hypothetical protein RRF57_012273 [Xylaria bambusicola]|uniref:Malic acid transport protein n=1 Tax=Xylaria bambusicola TaxID=326684 RepID=A0AAN7ZDJ2_9PEZI